MAEPVDPLDAEIARRKAAADPLDAEIARRRRENMSASEVLGDVGMSTLRGFNEGLASVATFPFRAAHEAGDRLRAQGVKPLLGMPDTQFPDALIKGGYLEPPAPLTTEGKFGHAIGETIGSSIIPEAGLMTRAGQIGRVAAPVATHTTLQRAGSEFMRPYVETPGRAIAADALAATGSGAAQEAAREGGFGPAGQVTAGIVGGMTPFAVAAPFSAARSAYETARANAAPHAKIGAKLNESGTGVDELSYQVAHGPGNLTDVYAQRVIDTLGQEMVNAGGNRQAALAATIQRLAREGGVSEARAREQLRNVVANQQESLLTLGEYPAVMRAEENTRGRTPQVIEDALDTARAMPNPEAAQAARIANDPGRIEDTGTHWMMDTVANSGDASASKTVRDMTTARAQDLHDQAVRRVESWSPVTRVNEIYQQEVGRAARNAPAGTPQQQIQDTAMQMAVTRYARETGVAPEEAARQLASWGAGTDADAAYAAINRMSRAGSAAYRNLYADPNAVDYSLMHPLLQRVVERHLDRLAGLGGEQAEALRQAIDQLYIRRPAGVAAREGAPIIEDQVAAARNAVREYRRQAIESGTPVDPLVQVRLQREADALAEQLRLNRREASPPEQAYLLPTLEQLVNQRSAIGKKYLNREGSGHEFAAVVGPLYRDLTRVMTRSSPRWANVNRQWRGMELNELGRDLGENLAMKAGPQFREQMRDFQRLAPEAQDFVRVEFVQKLVDKLANTGVTDDLAKIFKTPHVKQLVRTMLGDEAAVDMARMVRDAQVANKTKNMMGGSPTQPRQARQAELNSDLDMMENVHALTSPSKFLEAVKKYTIDRFKGRRNAEMARVLTTPVRDTPAVAEQLERIRQAQARSEAATARLRSGRPPGLGGTLGSIPAAGDNNPTPADVLRRRYGQ